MPFAEETVSKSTQFTETKLVPFASNRKRGFTAWADPVETPKTESSWPNAGQVNVWIVPIEHEIVESPRKWIQEQQASVAVKQLELPKSKIPGFTKE